MLYKAAIYDVIKTKQRHLKVNTRYYTNTIMQHVNNRFHIVAFPFRKNPTEDIILLDYFTFQLGSIMKYWKKIHRQQCVNVYFSWSVQQQPSLYTTVGPVCTDVIFLWSWLYNKLENYLINIGDLYKRFENTALGQDQSTIWAIFIEHWSYNMASILPLCKGPLCNIA